MRTPTLDRLRHAVAAHRPAEAAPESARERELPPIEQILRGTWLEARSGPVFVKDEWLPLDHQQGAITLGAALDADRGGLAHLLGAAHAPSPDRYAFFDVETTGLSGGTGTYVVLAGLGTYERAAPGEPLAFRLRQYFLAGPQYERPMLELLAADMAGREALVTYNGRAFDVPVTDSRFTLSRVPSPWRGVAHFDLLHAFRRLYKHRTPGCRLADAERVLLRIERPDDVPGSMIPHLYWEYVTAGRAAPLRDVLRHNADDVLSLAGVLSSLATLMQSDDHGPDDQVALARWWERAGDEARALRLYRAALPWLEGGDDWAWAAARMARLLRRAGERPAAADLWRRLWEAGDAQAGVEVAKYEEHQRRDITAAAETVTRLRSLPGAASDEALAHRAGRLARKLSNTNSLSLDRGVLAEV